MPVEIVGVMAPEVALNWKGLWTTEPVTVRSEKVATPLVAFTLVVPPSVPWFTLSATAEL
jgi:hypothetical protein